MYIYICILCILYISFHGWPPKCAVGFSILNVISAVFVAQTMKLTQQDTECMIIERERAKASFAKKMRALFSELDVSGDGLFNAHSWKCFCKAENWCVRFFCVLGN